MDRDYYGEIFSRRLKELRLERGFTIEEFANKVGISKSSVGYYESQNRVPDIIVAGEMADVLEVSADYLIGRSNARTQEPKLKSICNKTGLSDTSIKMLARLKEEKNTRLSIINLLLEQADSDIEGDYELSGGYEGSFLNAVCRYLDHYKTIDDYIADVTSSSDEGITDSIREAFYRLILDQAVDALKNLANSAKLVDAMFRGIYSDEE